LRSLSDAFDAVLAAWDARRLRADERLTVDALGDLALRRGLESLRLTGNLSMLRLLDLPSVLELRSPATEAPVYAALVAIDDSTVTLQVGNQPMSVAYGLLDRVWQGGAHVIWRDFESLGPTFGDEARGEHVARLQRLLARSGVYAGAPTGTFDADTEAAVLAFQRSRRLDPDCRVGRLTRIALYGAAGGYGTPTLAARPGTRGTVVAAHGTGDAS
jgi:general secretion pathway protein A